MQRRGWAVLRLRPGGRIVSQFDVAAELFYFLQIGHPILD